MGFSAAVAIVAAGAIVWTIFWSLYRGLLYLVVSETVAVIENYDVEEPRTRLRNSRTGSHKRTRKKKNSDTEL